MAHRTWAVAALLVATLPRAGASLAQTEAAATEATAAASTSSADHSKFEVLKKPIAAGPEVAQACLSCQTEASDQVIHTAHWQWDCTQPET